MRLLHDHEINDFNVDNVRVMVMDEPNTENGGGANHLYAVALGNTGPEGPGTLIRFQNGPISEVGINGITNEALLAIVLDRLRSFQRGPFSCRENAVAVTKLEESIMWLHKRTLDRVRRGVEGKHEK